MTASWDEADIMQSLTFGWALDPNNGVEEDTYWWFAVAVRGDCVVAVDEHDARWLVPYTIVGDRIEFGVPVPEPAADVAEP